MSNTLYINNLPSKVPNDKLRYQLYLLLSNFAEIINISILNNKQYRQQAFVTVRTKEEAVLLQKQMNKTMFFGNIINIEFSKMDTYDI